MSVGPSSKTLYWPELECKKGTMGLVDEIPLNFFPRVWKALLRILALFPFSKLCRGGGVGL